MRTFDFISVYGRISEFNYLEGYTYSARPPTVVCKLSWNMYTFHTRFWTFGTDLHAQSLLNNKKFCIGAQSKVYQECVVGWVGTSTSVKTFPHPPNLAKEISDCNKWAGKDVRENKSSLSLSTDTQEGEGAEKKTFKFSSEPPSPFWSTIFSSYFLRQKKKKKSFFSLPRLGEGGFWDTVCAWLKRKEAVPGRKKQGCQVGYPFEPFGYKWTLYWLRN